MRHHWNKWEFDQFFKPCKGVFILEIISLYCCYAPLLNLFLYSKKNENQLAFFNDETPRLVFFGILLWSRYIDFCKLWYVLLLKSFQSVILVSKSRSGSVKAIGRHVGDEVSLWLLMVFFSDLPTSFKLFAYDVSCLECVEVIHDFMLCFYKH